jgi:hypothetical protein
MVRREMLASLRREQRTRALALAVTTAAVPAAALTSLVAGR